MWDKCATINNIVASEQDIPEYHEIKEFWVYSEKKKGLKLV